MAHPPQPGWSGWYQYFAGIEQAHMEVNQARLQALREKLPISLIQMDDGYQPAWGDWLDHNHKFPNGVEGWANAVKADGFEPELWLSPFTVDKNSKFYRHHPDAVLCDARGNPTHGGFLINRWLLGLDPTHPATQEHVARCIETISQEWGIQYLKLDFLYCGALPGRRYDAKKTRAQALRDGLTLIRNLAGEDATILGCGCPSGPALGIVDILRVGTDVAPTWTPRLFGVSWPISNDQSMPSTRNALRSVLHRGWTHRRWWWLDADNVLARTQQHLTTDEVQTFLP
jgi:alpha-galactosidase